MKITKFGHCCFLIEEQGIKILTDPSVFSDLGNDLLDIDVILFTHKHQDHLNIESLRKILKNNNSEIFTNSSVGKILSAEGIRYQTLEDGQKISIRGIEIEAFGNEHEEIYQDMNKVQNTGYLIAEKLFYPGDAFYNPEKNIEILALPVAGPWLKIKDAIEYAKLIHPKICFPVHDGFIKWLKPYHNTPKIALEAESIDFIPMIDGDKKDI